jgi:hypothetical protein
MRRLAQTTAVLVLLIGSGIALAASGSRQVWVPACTKAAYKPTRLLLACGDGTNYLTGMAWSRWTARSATGSGTDEINDCKPDCASGHFHGYPTTVTLSKPKRCKRVKRHRVFGRIVLQYPNAHPGRSRSLSAQLPCPF